LEKDPSKLQGTRSTRVFIGGSYHGEARSLLGRFASVARRAGFFSIIADQYVLETPDRDVHDGTMTLLHNCRFAIFEASRASGAFMEIERVPDYGVIALVLYQQVAPPRMGESRRMASRMLSSFALVHSDRIQVSPYTDPNDASKQVRRWLSAMKKHGQWP
jgi:hypothetical protein